MILKFAGVDPDIGEDVYVAPNAVIIGDTRIGDNSSVWFGAAIRGDYGPITIGQGCSIQDNAVIHVNHNAKGEVFPTIIGDDCIIGHGAVVEGCSIGKGSLIGMNAVVLPRAQVGQGCIIAAGAVVKEGDKIPDYSLVAGAPAIVKRTFDGPSPDLEWAASEYRALGLKYLCEQDA